MRLYKSHKTTKSRNRWAGEEIEGAEKKRRRRGNMTIWTCERKG